MNAQRFQGEFEYYKENLAKSLDDKTVNLMMHAYCMGHCGLSNHLIEDDFEMSLSLDPVLDKINELNDVVGVFFKTTELNLPKNNELQIALHTEIQKAIEQRVKFLVRPDIQVLINKRLYPSMDTENLLNGLRLAADGHRMQADILRAELNKGNLHQP